MKMRAGFLSTCAASALVIGMGCASPVLAADKMVTKAPAAEPVQWWYDGFAEIGGRAYLNHPDKTKLGRFLRYEDFRPGVFGNFYFGAHRTGPDPLDITAWGKNVGWDDQAFELNLSKPGAYYLTFGWDETPHVYSKDAKTTFGPIGGNVLSTVIYPTSSLLDAQNTVNANSSIFDLGFRRDTASAKGRWTPNDNWDITADYSHLHRDGTQPLSAITFVSTGTGTGSPRNASIQLPKPVDDTTQNGNIKAEYAGTSPWGKSFNVALGYGLSLYNNNVGCGAAPLAGTSAPTSTSCLTFQNPWTSTDPLNGKSALWNRYALWPDNKAQNFSASAGVGLPFNSRYMGTVQYTIMTQDDPFLPSNITAGSVATLPRSSLGGDARTTLSNNVLNTQITSNLTSTLRYRYYDYHSNHSPMTITGLCNRPDTTYACTAEETAYPINFTKQNASGELVYRPWKWLDVGGIYEWERWRHEYNGATDVVTGVTESSFETVTNENAVKGFFDAKWGWSTLRTSVRYGERRFDGDYINATASHNNMRTVDLQDRNSTVVKSSWDINVTDTVSFTPTGGYRLDDYPADGINTVGISRYQSWNAGADISWRINPSLAVYVSYMHENGARDTFQNITSSSSTPVNERNVSRQVYHTRDLNDVFIVGGKFTVIPAKLFLNATYTYSKGTSRWGSECGPTGVCNPNPIPNYPDTHNTNQRIDASAKYMLDPTSFLRNAGFLQPYVKARVIWERNSNDSWQNIEQQLGWAIPGATDATLLKAVFLGMSNPNYDVVVGMLSFGVKW